MPDLTPAQRQAEFLAALGEHLHDHPHLAAIQLTDTIGDPRQALITVRGTTEHLAVALSHWARSLGVHSVLAIQTRRRCASARTTGLVGTVSVSRLTVCAVIEGLTLPYDWTHEDDDTELALTDLEYFAEHGALPKAGGRDA